MDLTDPATRLGVGMGLVTGTIIVVIAFVFLEGTMRYMALGIAVLDVVTTPWFLQQAAEEERSDEAEHAG